MRNNRSVEAKEILEKMVQTNVDPDLLLSMELNIGENLLEFNKKHPIMLVFLRHFGCVFCKEALADISERKSKLEAKGLKVVFVHMAKHVVADEYFKRYKIDNPIHISDPECEFYSEFGITKGNFSQLYGLRTWIRGYSARKVGHELELSKTLGDSTQMPGIYVIEQGKVKSKYIHKHASDRPNYEELANCCTLT